MSFPSRNTEILKLKKQAAMEKPVAPLQGKPLKPSLADFDDMEVFEKVHSSLGRNASSGQIHIRRHSLNPKTQTYDYLLRLDQDLVSLDFPYISVAYSKKHSALILKPEVEATAGTLKRTGPKKEQIGLQGVAKRFGIDFSKYAVDFVPARYDDNGQEVLVVQLNQPV